MKIKRVYIAGQITPTNGDHPAINYLENIRIGIRASVEVIFAGFRPFSPFIDFSFFLALRDGEKITYEDVLSICAAWLEVSDAILVLPDYEKSVGTIREIELAKKLGIPIFYNLENLKKAAQE